MAASLRKLDFLLNDAQAEQLLWQLSLLPKTRNVDITQYLKPSLGECQIFSDSYEGSKLTPLGQKGKIGSLYILTFNRIKTKFIVKFSIVNPTISFSDNPPRKLAVDSGVCFPGSDAKTSYLGLDEFSNESCIAYIVNKICEKSQFKFVVKYHRSFICQNQGVNLMEYCDLGDLSQFPRHEHVREKYTESISLFDEIHTVPSIVTVTQIFHQVIAGLDFLSQQAGFISGDLKAANIFVKTEKVSGSYRGMSLDAPFMCKISDYGKSSCLLKTDTENIRIFNAVSYANIYFIAGDFEPNFTKDGRYVVDDYLLTNTYANLRHMGSPYFRTYDFYTFVVSLLTVPEFYFRFFTSDYLLAHFWHPLWANVDEENEVKRRIDAYVSKFQHTGIGEAIGILKGISLSCTIINDLIEQQSV